MWKSPWLSRLILVVALLPLVWLGWRWYHNQLGINRIEHVARFTGSGTIRLLMITLAITPLRRIPGLNPIIRFRRLLGLLTFFWGCLHGLHYFAMDAQWSWLVIREDLTIRRFFIAGMFALSMMAPLAATSFNASIRWMGGKRWQLLHRLVYVSAISGVVHYLWQGKSLVQGPLIYAAILLLLFLVRGVLWFNKSRRSVPATA